MLLLPCVLSMFYPMGWTMLNKSFCSNQNNEKVHPHDAIKIHIGVCYPIWFVFLPPPLPLVYQQQAQQLLYPDLKRHFMYVKPETPALNPQLVWSSFHFALQPYIFIPEKKSKRTGTSQHPLKKDVTESRQFDAIDVGNLFMIGGTPLWDTGKDCHRVTVPRPCQRKIGCASLGFFYPTKSQIQTTDGFNNLCFSTYHFASLRFIMFHVKQMFSKRKTKSLTEPKWLKMADHGHHDRGVSWASSKCTLSQNTEVGTSNMINISQTAKRLRHFGSTFMSFTNLRKKMQLLHPSALYSATDTS